jgi:hypothetical protein
MTTITLNINEKTIWNSFSKVQVKEYLEDNLKNILFQMELENDIKESKKSPKSDFLNL